MSKYEKKGNYNKGNEAVENTMHKCHKGTFENTKDITKNAGNREQSQNVNRSQDQERGSQPSRESSNKFNSNSSSSYGSRNNE